MAIDTNSFSKIYIRAFRPLLLSLFICFSHMGGAQSSSVSVPNGYQVIYSADMELPGTVLDNMHDDTWYFYADANSAGSTGGEDNSKFHDRFTIVDDPQDPTNKVMRQTLFDGDIDYSGGTLNPRTEISTRDFLEVPTSKEIYFKIRTYFPSSQFAAEFIQFWVHASPSIPLQIEVRNGKFGARIPRSGGYHEGIPFDNKVLSDYVGQWITWEVRAKFTKSNGGYWHIYMDGEKVFEDLISQGIWADENEDWHSQFGVYSGSQIGTQVAFFDDFVVAEYTGDGFSNAPVITELQLVNEIEQTIVSGFNNLEVVNSIDLSEIENSELNVYAQIEGSVDSVTFVYDLNGEAGSRREINPPYAVRGDGGGYADWNLELGEYSIQAFAWSGGEALDTAWTNFEVYDAVMDIMSDIGSQSNLYTPNPIEGKVHLTRSSIITNFIIMKPGGEVVESGMLPADVDLTNCDNGLYFLVLIGENLRETEKVIITH